METRCGKARRLSGVGFLFGRQGHADRRRATLCLRFESAAVPGGAGAMTRRGSPVSLKSGFTLLEAIVAMTIIGVALVPILTFISQMANGLSRAADSNARSLAQQA